MVSQWCACRNVGVPQNGRLAKHAVQARSVSLGFARGRCVRTPLRGAYLTHVVAITNVRLASVARTVCSRASVCPSVASDFLRSVAATRSVSPGYVKTGRALPRVRSAGGALVVAVPVMNSVRVSAAEMACVRCCMLVQLARQGSRVCLATARHKVRATTVLNNVLS